ncbi:hypothetical protein RUMHYD_01347 [Blautia hydrogenotrophica DSM 10507]|uniref:Uncharacterized protein n=1 Tax=Blautia hydrogenotrophica (strain DSM 10507 / JCM 14656 / S5a33) TaxID=476272 RepID=C0CKH7_BLAHS|nr:hypothetical protein RUMHYD_01347 [Blautia hydrogenotrophica DSM 10507]
MQFLYLVYTLDVKGKPCEGKRNVSYWKNYSLHRERRVVIIGLENYGKFCR